MSPELSSYLAEITELISATEALFSQKEEAVSEADILSAAEKIGVLGNAMMAFPDGEKAVANERLGEALEIVEKCRDAAKLRWENERKM